MSIKFGFFDSVDGDRKYNADTLTNPFMKLVSNGVFPTPSTNLQVISVPKTRTIYIKSGWAFINCKWFYLDENYYPTIETSDVALNRIDRIVLRLDYDMRLIRIDVKKGTPATTPSAPALIRTSSIYELGLADILIVANSTILSQSNITDLRGNTTYCGWVTGLITQIDTSTLFTQYNTAFYNWFDDVKSEIQQFTCVQSYSAKVNMNAGITTIPVPIENYNADLDVLNVYVNGLKLINDIDYTQANGNIVLTNEITVDNTEVAFESLKSIDVKDVDTIATEFIALSTKFYNYISDTYFCNGINDNEVLTQMFAEMTTEKNHLFIVGNYGSNGTSLNADFSNRNMPFKLDFSKCEFGTLHSEFANLKNCIVKNLNATINITSSACNVFDADDCKFESCNIISNEKSNAGVLVIFDADNCIFRDCKINCKNTSGAIYGISGTENNIHECTVYIETGASTAICIAGAISIDNSNISAKSKSSCKAIYISSNLTPTTITNSKIIALSESEDCYDIYTVANCKLMINNINCPSKSEGTMSTQKSLHLAGSGYYSGALFTNAEITGTIVNMGTI